MVISCVYGFNEECTRQELVSWLKLCYEREYLNLTKFNFDILRNNPSIYNSAIPLII